MTSLFQRSKIKKAAFSLLASVALGSSLVSCAGKEKEKSEVTETKPVIIGYVGGFHGLVNTDEIAANKLTHINYAFVNVQDGKAFLTNEKTDSTNFRKLNLLKKINPELKILISIGGWAWSENFSDAVLNLRRARLILSENTNWMVWISTGNILQCRVRKAMCIVLRIKKTSH
jgi:chitinase